MWNTIRKVWYYDEIYTRARVMSTVERENRVYRVLGYVYAICA